MKKMYSQPLSEVSVLNIAKNYMLEDWSAPDGGGGGGNEPEANENGLFEEETLPKGKSVWEDK